MNHYRSILSAISKAPKRWLVTGVAGFIGSNLLEALLRHGQFVVGIDNFSTGHPENLDDVRQTVTAEEWSRFSFLQGDVACLGDCEKAFKLGSMQVDFVLHQAALGSVPRSIDDPITTNRSNIDGFLNILIAARDANVARFVYAASSSTYGDHPGLPKREENIGQPLSPYAVTKYVNELYAHVFGRIYQTQSIGLRYFNVFGKRQDPNGSYAAVIPRWAAAAILDNEISVNGDGETSRDFCYVDNVVQANILAAHAPDSATNTVYNIACGARTSLNELYKHIVNNLKDHGIKSKSSVVYRDFRQGDVRHSLADISKAERMLGFAPEYSVHQGLALAIPWYIRRHRPARMAH